MSGARWPAPAGHGGACSGGRAGRSSRAVLAALSTLFAAGTASAAPIEALGQAPVVAGNRASARQRALDDGLRQAVDGAALSALGAERHAALAEPLRRRLLPRARALVASFRILEEGERDGGLYQVRLAVELDAVELARALAALGAAAAPPPAGGAPAGAGRRPGVLVVAASPGAAPARDAVVRGLAARGYQAQPAPPGTPAAPVDDVGLAGLVAAAGVAVGIAVELGLQEAYPLRATALWGAEATVRLRLRAVARDVALEAEGSAARFGDDEPGARAAAIAAAAAEGARRLGVELDRSFPAPLDGGPRVEVTVTGAPGWADYVELTRLLLALPGVDAVEPRRFLSGAFVLAVATARPAAELGRALAGGAGPLAAAALEARSDHELAIRLPLAPQPAEGGALEPPR